jgi:D-alanyl-D-alanine carboxypeptidase/D-alanyl-D-alanine-endopeptidase (penicillin-binding protein 4)
MPDPEQQFAATLLARLSVKEKKPLRIVYTPAVTAQTFHTEQSPSLDSLIYWFNKKSINLYGEALLRTIGYQKMGRGSTENGIAILKSFWAEKGISKTALNLVDGSGLSPLNRITTQAQAAVLHYARKQPWFPGFYTALPEYNGMKLKSGTIQNVKGFAGYHTSRAGVSYTIAFLINNYDGSSATLVKKMYAVLDVLK